MGSMKMPKALGIFMAFSFVYNLCHPDRAFSADAAAALKLTADDLRALGVVDDIIPEPLGGAHQDVAGAAEQLKRALVTHLDELSAIPPQELIEQRYRKFRGLGVFKE